MVVRFFCRAEGPQTGSTTRALGKHLPDGGNGEGLEEQTPIELQAALSGRGGQLKVGWSGDADGRALKDDQHKPYKAHGEERFLPLSR